MEAGSKVKEEECVGENIAGVSAVLPVPKPGISLREDEGIEVFRRALHAGTMRGYFMFSNSFDHQHEPCFCNLATICACFNALQIPAPDATIGSWAFFTQETLKLPIPLQTIRKQGLTWKQLELIMGRYDVFVKSRQLDADHTYTVEKFRRDVKKTLSEGDLAIAVNYTRKALGQAGGGHWSPLGGYDEAEDLVLILDVAKFKYPPHWVPLQALFDGMNTLDGKRGRGWMVLERFPEDAPELQMDQRFISLLSRIMDEAVFDSSDTLRDVCDKMDVLASIENLLKFDDLEGCYADLDRNVCDEIMSVMRERYPGNKKAICAHTWTIIAMMDMLYEMDGHEDVDGLDVHVQKSVDVESMHNTVTKIMITEIEHAFYRQKESSCFFDSVADTPQTPADPPLV